MKKTLKIIVLFITIAVLLSVCCLYFCGKRSLLIQTPNGQVITYRVERALTPKDQQKGLMNRSNLRPKTGMIFLFNPPRVAHMWMKDTLIPLDMIFFDKNGRVLHVHHKAIPHDETIISTLFPVAGVLEINAGEANQYGITVGTKLNLDNMQ